MSNLLYSLLSLHAFVCMPSVMYDQTLVMSCTRKLFVIVQAWHRIEPDDAFNIHFSPFGCHIRKSGPWHQYHWCPECVKHELTGTWINSTQCISKFLHIVASKAPAGGTGKFNDSSDQRLQSRSNLDCALLRLGEILVCHFNLFTCFFPTCFFLFLRVSPTLGIVGGRKGILSSPYLAPSAPLRMPQFYQIPTSPKNFPELDTGKISNPKFGLL